MRARSPDFLIRLLAFLMTLALATCGPGTDESPPGHVEGASEAERGRDRSPAAAAHRKALDAFARLDGRSMFRRMRAAWEMDRSFIPAIVDLLAYYNSDLRLPTNVRLALDSLVVRDPRGNGACARFILARRRPLWGPEVAAAAHGADPGAHPCATFARVQAPGVAGPEERVRLAELLWRRYPDSPRLAQDLLVLLSRKRSLDRLLVVAEEMARPERHPLLRARGFAWRVNALASLRRWDDAMAAKRAGDTFVSEEYPWTRHAYLTGLRWIHNATLFQRSDPLRDPMEAVRDEVEEELRAVVEGADLYATGPVRARRARSLLDAGLLTESLSVWDELVEVADTFVVPVRSRIFMRRGRTLSKLGDLPAAERDLLKARKLAARVDDDETALEVEHNLLHVYEATGRDEAAREAGRAFVEITENRPIEPVRMMAYYDFGTFLRRRGEHDAARKMFESMLATIDSLDDYHHWAGEYHESRGDLDRAIANYERSWRENQHDAPRALAALTRIAEATGDGDLAERYARIHDAELGPAYPEDAPRLPGVLARAGKSEAALEELDAARQAARSNGQVAAWSRLTLEAARIELERGGLATAGALADSAASAAGSVAEAQVAVRGRGLSALARISRGGGGCEQALAELREAVEGAERSIHLPLRTELFEMLGDALSALDRTEQALAAYRRAARLSDAVALSLAHDLVRAGFRAEQLRISNHALATVLERRRHPDAPVWYAAWSLRRKGRGILEARRPASSPPSRAPGGDGSGADAPAGEGTAPWKEAGRLMREVRSTLADDRALIDYVVLDRVTAALVLTREKAEVVVLPAEARPLRDRTRRLLARLRPRVGSFVDVSRASFDRTLARRLYQELVAPLEPVLADRSRVTIVPDAPLHLVPFDALVVSGEESPPRYLVDRYTLTMATSLGSVADGTVRLPPGRVVTVAALDSAEAPATGREVDAIARAFPDRDVVRLTGGAATEAAVRGQAGDAAILHFAAHAHPNALDPDYAHLSLVEDGDDDGLLHVHEIRRLRLPSSLVVLSACESAGGRLVRGEGPLSLSRAFLQAGAGSVVGTLWPVGPSAGPLMEEFYRSLARGGSSPADALRSAKLFLRDTHPDPFHWGAFVVVGGTS